VRFISPASELPAEADSQTDVQTLEHIYQQLITKDAQTAISRIEFVNLKDSPWFHRLSSVQLPRPPFDNFLSLFREVVQQNSEKCAVESWDKHLTYSELESASTAVATVLHSLGVKHGNTVVLALEWSSWAPVCALALFKVGAALSFIQTHEPTARVDMFLEKVKGRIVLCDATNHDRFSECSAQVFSVQSLPLEIAATSVQGQYEEAGAADVAFVLFTSGSTGKPKAVLTSHQALAAGAKHQAKALGMSESSRVLGEGPLCFAGVLPKLLFSLAIGAQLCIPHPSQGVVEAANQLRTDWLLLLIGAASQIDPTHFTMRQTVNLGSEVISASLARLWGSHHKLRVVYGVTETNTVFSGGPWESAISTRDVGSSAAHRVWIVDPNDHDRLLPLGWPGEVLLQSAALASAYSDDEAATARAFPSAPLWYAAVAKPQSSTTSMFGEPCNLPVRWYKTGDMGRLDPKTLSLEVFGRIDLLQLALPGGRVDVTALEETAEAATAKTGKPLRIAVQLGVPRGERVPRVVAFLESEHYDGTKPGVRIAGSGVVQHAALRRELRDAWARFGASPGPEYFVVVEGLPRLYSGKIWRHFLREWIGMHTTEELAMWRLVEEHNGSA
jgi:acyl-CoA synthetase (AMP-forming)/AMP-acid ligase II